MISPKARSKVKYGTDNPRNQLTPVSIEKVLKETEKAFQVIYTHFENPAEYAIVWLPKSQTVTPQNNSTSVCWKIPVWLKNKIADTATRLIKVN